MDVAPFTVTDLDGKTISMADLKGKVVLVNFWATWCPPCRAEIPDLVRLQEKYRDKLVVLGISEDEDASPQEVKAFGAEQKMNYPIVDEDARAGEDLQGCVRAADDIRDRSGWQDPPAPHRDAASRRRPSSRRGISPA